VVVELPDRYRVIETRVAAFDLEEAVRLFLEARATGTRLRAHFCTTHTLVEATDNPRLRDALNQPDAVAAPDGMPLVWVGRAMGRDVGRVCGPDLCPAVIGNVLVYLDDNHLTASYSASMAPLVEGDVLAALGF